LKHVKNLPSVIRKGFLTDNPFLKPS